MSRAYDMDVQVAEFQADHLEAIKTAAQHEWEFEWATDSPTLLAGFGESSLCGGETEEQFGERLARAIWAANDGFCQVYVTATYMDDLPHEDYAFDEQDFERIQSLANIPLENP